MSENLALVPPESLPAEYVDEERPEVRTGWRIEGGTSEADWAFARMQEHEAQIAAVDDQIALAVARIERRGTELKRKAAWAVEFFRAALMEWGDREKRTLLGGGRKKSRELLHGVVGWRTKNKGGKLKWIDEAATLEWAKAQPIELGLFRVVYQIDKLAIEKLARERDLIPVGCDLDLERDEVYVKTTTTP